MRIQVFTTMFLAGIIPVILFSNIIIKAYNSQIITQRTDEIQSYATVIAKLIENLKRLPIFIREGL